MADQADSWVAISGAFEGPRGNAQQPTSLQITAEQAAQLLGVGRSTAYELVRNGDLEFIRRRRRVVVLLTHLAERQGVDRKLCWFDRADRSPAGCRAGTPTGAPQGNLSMCARWNCRFAVILGSTRPAFEYAAGYLCTGSRGGQGPRIQTGDAFARCPRSGLVGRRTLTPDLSRLGRCCHTPSLSSAQDPALGGAVVRKMTPAQYNAWARQENAKRKRAVDAHNAEVRRVNARNERAVADHNRRVAAHNKQVVADYNRRARAHNDRLRREIAKLNATTSIRHATYRQSVTTLRASFGQLEEAADNASWSGAEDLLDLSESETANSVAALNALLTDAESDPVKDEEVAALRSTVITGELGALSHDLDARWRGALFSLHPDNPDASRHFCTSARELLGSLLEAVAPDAEVLAVDPHCERTPQGSISRRAHVRHCLNRRGGHDPVLEEFIEADLDNILSLFAEFNSGTHGVAGRFDMTGLTAIKVRVEGAIQFVSRIAAAA